MRASFRPLAPRPMMPRVLPASSLPGGSPTTPAANDRRAGAPARQREHQEEGELGHGLSVPPGTLRTAMPRAAAASRSSCRAGPNCTIAFRGFAAAITGAVMRATEGTRGDDVRDLAFEGPLASTRTSRSPLPSRRSASRTRLRGKFSEQ